MPLTYITKTTECCGPVGHHY